MFFWQILVEKKNKNLKSFFVVFYITYTGVNLKQSSPELSLIVAIGSTLNFVPWHSLDFPQYEVFVALQ